MATSCDSDGVQSGTCTMTTRGTAPGSIRTIRVQAHEGTKVLDAVPSPAAKRTPLMGFCSMGDLWAVLRAVNTLQGILGAPRRVFL